MEQNIIQPELEQNIIQPELEQSINKQLSGCTNSVYLYLLRYHYSKDKHAAWPTQSTIAEFLNIDKKSVKRAIKQLEKEGYIKVKRSSRNTYTFPLVTIDTTNMEIREKQ